MQHTMEVLVAVARISDGRQFQIGHFIPCTPASSEYAVCCNFKFSDITKFLQPDFVFMTFHTQLL